MPIEKMFIYLSLITFRAKSKIFLMSYTSLHITKIVIKIAPPPRFIFRKVAHLGIQEDKTAIVRLKWYIKESGKHGLA